MYVFKPLLFTVAALASTPEAGDPLAWASSSDHITTCDYSTFAHLSAATPSNWRDCVSLLSTWDESGSFTINQASPNVYLPILVRDSCTLAVKPAEEGGGPYTIGDIDVRRILDRSCLDYSNGSVFAVQGLVRCDSGGDGRRGLEWVLFDAGI